MRIVMELNDYVHFAGDWSEAEREMVERALEEFELEVGAARRTPDVDPKPLICLKVQVDAEPPRFAAYRLGREDLVAAKSAKELAAKIYRIVAFGTSGELEEPDWRGGISRAQLRKVFDFVHTHLGEPIKVIDMAQQACLSEAHFAREFKRSLQETPLAYLTRSRVEKAQQLLRHTEFKIAEIARRVGLPNASNFSKVFRDHVGMTPSRYRRGRIVEVKASGTSEDDS